MVKKHKSKQQQVQVQVQVLSNKGFSSLFFISIMPL